MGRQTKDGSINEGWRPFVKRNKSKPNIIDRYLELDEINSVLNALVNYHTNNDQQKFQVIRARYIILLLFYTGLRIAEAANHTMGNFLQHKNNWFLRVISKGKKMRTCSG
jgi:site-specific recombinase XerD